MAEVRNYDILMIIVDYYGYIDETLDYIQRNSLRGKKISKHSQKNKIVNLSKLRPFFMILNSPIFQKEKIQQLLLKLLLAHMLKVYPIVFYEMQYLRLKVIFPFFNIPRSEFLFTLQGSIFIHIFQGILSKIQCYKIDIKELSSRETKYKNRKKCISNNFINSIFNLIFIIHQFSLQQLLSMQSDQSQTINKLMQVRKNCVYQRDTTSKFWKDANLRRRMKDAVNWLDEAIGMIKKQQVSYEKIEDNFEQMQAQSKTELEELAVKFEKLCPEKIHIGVQKCVASSAPDTTKLAWERYIFHNSEVKEKPIDQKVFQEWILKNWPVLNGDSALVAVVKIQDLLLKNYQKYCRTIIAFRKGTLNHTSFTGFKAKTAVSSLNHDFLIVIS